MATNNFHYVNTSRCFAVLMSSSQEEVNEHGEVEEVFSNPDSSDYYSLIDEIRSEMQEMRNRIPNLSFYNGGEDEHELRSFPSKVIGSIRKNESMFGVDISVTLTAVIRSGYYDGACLDYCYHIDVDLDNIEDGIKRDGADKVVSDYTQHWCSKLAVELEKVFNMYSTPMVKIATASNGETFYRNVGE